jgi:hypothetical protein
LRSENASVALAAAREILDRAGLKSVARPTEEKALDFRKLSTEELVVLDCDRATFHTWPQFVPAPAMRRARA